MIVRNLRREHHDGKVRLAADVVHESAPVPVMVVFYEVDEHHEAALGDTIDPFLVATFLPAILHRESRVVVEGDVAPLLVAGLRCVMEWHHAWFGPRHAPIALEAGLRNASMPARGAAIYLSGGVDSLFSLRRNQMWYPASHPCRIRYAILVDGFDVRRPEAFRIAAQRAGIVAAEAGVDLVVVKSNVPILDDDYAFWTRQFGGAGFCSIVHALTPVIERAWFSSNADIAHLFPWSLHPATDGNYSSADVEITQDGIEYSRLDKVRMLAEWEVARRHVRVCTKNPVGALNCGVCEKCIRTQLEFLVAGQLANTAAFPANDLTAAQVRSARIRSHGQFVDEAELVPALRAVGRGELADAVDANIREFHDWEAWRDGTRLKHRIARALHLR